MKDLEIETSDFQLNKISLIETQCSKDHLHQTIFTSPYLIPSSSQNVFYNLKIGK